MSRYTVSPTAPSTPASGDVWLDETNYHSRKTYDGTYWRPESRAATCAVAASSSPAHVKAQADYVCSGTADNVPIQAAIDALTAGRTWVETVMLIGGRFNIGYTAGNGCINVPSYTKIDIRGEIVLQNGVNKDIIANSDQVAGNAYIQITGGIVDGNAANQTGGAGVIFLNVNIFTISDMVIKDTYIDTVKVATSTQGVIDKITCIRSGNHSIFVGHQSSYVNVSNIVSKDPGTEHICIEWHAAVGYWNHHINVSNVVGSGAQNAGFYVQHAYAITLSNLISRGSVGYGLRIYDAYDVSVSNVRIYDAVPFGVSIGGSLDNDTYNVSLVNVSVDGVTSETNGDGFAIGGKAQDITLVNCVAKNIKRYGFNLAGAERVTMTGCISQNTENFGFVSGTTTKDILVQGSLFNNTYGILFSNNTYRASFVDNIIKGVTNAYHYVRMNVATHVIFRGNRILSELGTYPNQIFWITNTPANSRITIEDNDIVDAPRNTGVLYTDSNHVDSVITFRNNKGYVASGDIITISKSIDHATLTDGGGATGYVDFANVVPAGSIIKAVKVDYTEAWNSTNTTTLTMMIGYVGDLDAFNLTAAPGENAFNTTTDVYWGESSCQASIVTSAATPRVTFTEDDDITHIISGAGAQGAVTITITYMKA